MSRRRKARKRRKLSLRVTGKAPRKTKKNKFIKTLIRSIRRGDYRLPKGYNVTIHWGNKGVADRSGEWEEEMLASRESSPGFDMAVIRYLESKIERKKKHGKKAVALVSRKKRSTIARHRRPKKTRKAFTRRKAHRKGRAKNKTVRRRAKQHQRKSPRRHRARRKSR